MSEVMQESDLGEGVLRLEMCDPENQNRLTERFCAELVAALESAGGRPDLKVLVLAGLDEVFCAGAALDVLQKIATGETRAKDLGLAERLLSFPVPIVGAVAGHAVGGGLTLALCCDIVVAAEGKRYGANFTSLGFTPGMGTTGLLPLLVGHQFASEMMYTAKLYKGRELRTRGLFTHVVENERVLEVACEIARRIADKPRRVLEALKRTLARPRRRAVEQALEHEHEMHKICFRDRDVAARLEDAYLG